MLFCLWHCREGADLVVGIFVVCEEACYFWAFAPEAESGLDVRIERDLKGLLLSLFLRGNRLFFCVFVHAQKLCDGDV